MEEQTKIDNYLHTIEDHIMTNQITPQRVYGLLSKY